MPTTLPGFACATLLIVLGFFCSGLALAFCAGIPSGQVAVHGSIPQCPDRYGQPQVQTIVRNGRRVAAYVDDSLGPAEAAAQRCARQFVPTVYSGRAGGPVLPNSLQEWYPVRDHRSRVGRAPRPGSAGYILQSFSWGDNLEDGITAGRCTPMDTTAACASRYQAPSLAQLRAMWCAARRHHPRVILWYYASRETPLVLRAERSGCPGMVAG